MKVSIKIVNLQCIKFHWHMEKFQNMLQNHHMVWLGHQGRFSGGGLCLEACQ